MVLFSLSVWEELLYPHALVAQAVCILLWMLASVTELLWWGLAGCSETWVFAWLLAHALALLVPFHPEVCASLSVELGRKREAWLQPTCLLWADLPGYLSLEQDSQFQDWHTWARLSRHKKKKRLKDLVKRRAGTGSQKAPELFRKFKVRHKQASYRRSFSTEKSFLWPPP